MPLSTCGVLRTSLLERRTATSKSSHYQLVGDIVLPYRDPRLAYVSRIPYEVLRPTQKRFVQDPLRRRYGLGDIVERRRASIHEGTGLYDSFKARLEELARTQGLSRRASGAASVRPSGGPVLTKGAAADPPRATA
jgi:hypothetical protein